jgi:[ribosomal protein S18]-alanine N-acetyltransferase
MARLKKTEQLPPQIRWLIRRDMPEVMEIENRSYEFPWTEEEFLTCLRQRNCIGTVYESGSLILGFMIYELYARTLRVLNLAVAPEVRGTGVGAAMIQRLIDKLDQQKRTFIEMEIRERNLKAQLFASRSGFRAVRTLRRHYEETNEDAILFRYSLQTPANVAAVDGSNRINQYFEEA